MRRTSHVLVLALAILTAGCAAGLGGSPGEDASADETPPERTVPGLATVPPSDEPMTGEVPAEIMTRLLADAAERGDVADDAIEVIEAVSVTWSDGSLDCPEPGMLYTQALVDGYHVVLEAGGEELDYRVTLDGGFRLCEDGRTPSGG